MSSAKLLGVELPQDSKSAVLEKIKRSLRSRAGFVHVVSLNPENIVIAQTNEAFMKTVRSAQMRIIDGIGVVIAARFLQARVGERMPGVEVVHYLLEWEGVERLRVAFIGGRGNLAEELADCYQAKWPQAQFVGMIGIKDIQNPGENEEKKLFSIVAELKPHLVLVAFGSPAQELWIEANKGRFGPAVVMGVGGAFDFLGGRVARAPKWMRATGLEWLFRLARQPWRLRRQMRLIEFMWLVILQRVGARKSE